MAKIIVSNNTLIHSKITAHFLRASWCEEQTIHNSGFILSKFFKTTNAVRTMAEFSNGDFILISGTCLTINQTDDRLAYIYENFDGVVDTIREKLIGCYCIVIKKKGRIYLFTDNFGTYKIYFYFKNDILALSNTLFPLASALDCKEVDELNLLEYSFQHSILQNGTIFKDLYELGGNRAVVINTTSGETTFQELPQHYPELIECKSIDEIAHFLSLIFRKYFHIITREFKNISLNITGGLDSRLILAALMAAGCRPSLLYGKGNSPLTNTKDSDLEINRLIADKFELELHVMNWNDDDEFRSSSGLLATLQKFDEYYQLYGANANIFKEYESVSESKTDFIEFGYFGEMLRNLPWTESLRNDPIDIETLLDHYLYLDISAFSPYGGTFRKKMKAKVGQILCDLTTRHSADGVSKDEFQRFHARYRYQADSIMTCFVNNINNSFITCGIPEIHNYILSIPFNIKADASFQLRLIHHLFPPLLEVPFFSHTEKWYFDRDQFKLFPASKPGLTKSRLFDHLRKNATAKKLYNKLKMLLPLASKQDKDLIMDSMRLKSDISERIGLLQKELNLELIYPSKYYGDVRSLIKYYQMLYMIKNL